jgi:RNA-directed DNA polymerase
MRLNRQKSAEAIVTGALKCVSCEGLNVKIGDNFVSSHGKRRQQKTSNEGCPQEGSVNPMSTAGAPSFPSARTKDESCEVKNKLMESVVKRSNILQALDRVEKNKGAAGIDGMTVNQLRAYLNANDMQNWKRIKAELLTGSYKPSPVRRKSIPKPGGGERLLGIPTVLDRLIQQAIMQVLTPIFDPEFSKFSFGFRPKRSAHQAVKQAQQYIAEGYRYVVDMDLEKFFDRVNHDILMSKLAGKIDDKRILKVIRAFLESGIMVNGCCLASDEGTPQGGPLSPLLANIMLDDLDKELKNRGHKFVRYADDCNIYKKSKRAGQRVLRSITRFLHLHLKLKVNENKSAVDRPWERKFLGFSFTSEIKSRIRFSAKSIDRFKDKIRQLTRRSKGISMKERIDQVNIFITGWIGYFRLADTPSALVSLDEWIRRRLRACLLKSWKYPRTKKRNLIALGINENAAGRISNSRKSYWRLSKTPQLNKSLSIAFWCAQGLNSLIGSYQKLRLSS